MPSVSTKRVPNEGSSTASVMVVGEAPGRDEESEGRPFVGRSGQLLRRYLGRAGIDERDVYFANLCHYRPAKNRFKTLLRTDALKEGLAELGETIKQVDPNVIVAVGNWPLWYLTGQKSPAQRAKPGSGISTWRGSILPAVDDSIEGIAGKKVVATYHPAYIIRPQGFKWNPIFLQDIYKVAEEAKTSDIVYPQYDSHIDPGGDFLSGLAEEMAEAEWLSVDIETFGTSLACIGFADSPERGITLTYEHPGLNWEVAQFLLQSPAKKIFQFGAFDITWCREFMSWSTNNYAFDTYIAANSISPEFPKGLDFLTSIYTRFPFYKEERKEWKNTGDLTSLWEYNIKDIIATITIAKKQMEELKERW